MLIAAGFGLVMLGINHFLPILLGTMANKKGKLDPYECGVGQLQDTRARFSVKFYVVALMFVLFDIETVFLIPRALANIREPLVYFGRSVRIRRRTGRRPDLRLEAGCPRVVVAALR